MAGNKKTAKRTNKIKTSKFSKYNLWVFVLVFAAIGGYVLWRSFAATPPASPSIYLSPDTQSLNVDDTFTVNVYEDSGTDTINVVQANLSYSTSLLSYISYTNSPTFSLEAQNPTADNGLLKFARGTCSTCAPVSGVQQIVSITFKALAAGNATVDFSSGTLVVRSTDNKAESPLNQAGGVYTVAAPAPPPTTPPSSGSTTPTSTPTSTSTTTTVKPKTSTVTTSPSQTTTTPAAPSVTQNTPPTTPSSSNLTTTPAASAAPANSANILKVGLVAAIMALVLTGLFLVIQHVHLQPGFGSNTANSLIIPAAPAPAMTPTIKPTPAPAPVASAPVKPAVSAARIIAPNKPAKVALLRPANIPKKA